MYRPYNSIVWCYPTRIVRKVNNYSAKVLSIKLHIIIKYLAGNLIRLLLTAVII